MTLGNNIFEYIMITITIIAIIIISILYFNLNTEYEYFNNINLDKIQKNLDDIKKIGDNIYNKKIDNIYNNYFESNLNDTDNYLDGSFPTYGAYKIPDQKKKIKNYKCPF